MSLPEIPSDTEAKQILAALEDQGKKLDELTKALNGVGANVQWVIDNVQGIFEMFSNPAFMAKIPQMMGGGNPNGG